MKQQIKDWLGIKEPLEPKDWSEDIVKAVQQARTDFNDKLKDAVIAKHREIYKEYLLFCGGKENRCFQPGKVHKPSFEDFLGQMEGK